MKILITGNKNKGLAKVLYKHFSQNHEVECISREGLMDLSTIKGREELTYGSIVFDVFINCSKLHSFNQTIILKKVWDRWMSTTNKGHIINIGSTVDTGLKGGSRLYTVEKVALRNLSRKLSLDATSGNGIKVTYLSLGYLDTLGVSFADKIKISLEEVCNTIQWILDFPVNVNINEISMDPIQK